MDNANQAAAAGGSSTAASASSNCIANENATESASSNPPAAGNGKAVTGRGPRCPVQNPSVILRRLGDAAPRAAPRNAARVGADAPAAAAAAAGYLVQRVVDFVPCFSVRVHGDAVGRHHSLQRGLCSRGHRQRRCQVRRGRHAPGGFPHAAGGVHPYSEPLPRRQREDSFDLVCSS